MNLQFDHLVYLTSKPEKMVSSLNTVGLHVVEGGHHAQWGSYNSLSYFGLSYIEFLGIENWEIANKVFDNRLIMQSVEKLKRGEEGPVRIALRTDNIDMLAESLRKQGVTVYGPYPGERTRKDGKTIKWSLLFPENSHEYEPEYPFFIQWDQSDEERLQELKEQRLIGFHPIGNRQPSFTSVGFAVNQLEKIVQEWGRLFALNRSEVFVDETLSAKCQRLYVTGTELLFCEPIGEGIVSQVIKNRGETPFLIHLTNTGKYELFEKAKGLWKFE